MMDESGFEEEALAETEVVNDTIEDVQIDETVQDDVVETSASALHQSTLEPFLLAFGGKLPYYTQAYQLGRQ